MGSATTDSKTPYKYAHTSTPKAAWSHRYTAAKKNDKPTAAATAAQTRYLSSPAAATLHGKTQGFVLRLPPQNRALATSCTTPLYGCQFPSSPLPFIITSLPLHFPSSPLPFLTTSLRHHSPSSSLPFFTASLRHHFPSSPLPFVTTPLHHHFPSSPLPFVTTSVPHHFPSSPPPFLTTPLHHHFPSSPLPFLTTSHRNHIPSSPPCVIASYSFVTYCYIMYCSVIYHPSSKSTA